MTTVWYRVFQGYSLVQTLLGKGQKEIDILGCQDDSIRVTSSSRPGVSVPFTVVPASWKKDSEVTYQGKIYRGSVLEYTDKRVKILLPNKSIINTSYDTLTQDHSVLHDARRVILGDSVTEVCVVSYYTDWIKWYPVVNVKTIDNKMVLGVTAQIESSYDKYTSVSGNFTLIAKETVQSQHISPRGGHMLMSSKMSSAAPVPSQMDVGGDETAYSTIIPLGDMAIGSVTNYPLSSMEMDYATVESIVLPSYTSSGRARTSLATIYGGDTPLPPAKYNVDYGEVSSTYNINRGYSKGEPMILPLYVSDSIRYDVDVDQETPETLHHQKRPVTTSTYKLSIHKIKDTMVTLYISLPLDSHLISVTPDTTPSLSRKDNLVWMVQLPMGSSMDMEVNIKVVTK
jgi:hypothetical protein